MSDLASRRDAAVEAFDMARRETGKAWSTTALLSMVNVKMVDSFLDHFSAGDPARAASRLVEVAGPSFDAYCVKHGLDGSVFVRASEQVIRLLCRDLRPCGSNEEALAQLDAVYDRARAWIRDGQVPRSSAAEDLHRIAQLMGDEPEARLALLAPLSPAVASAEAVLRAASQSYPFPRGA